jgi:type VI secretion system secreted protein Hcp
MRGLLALICAMGALLAASPAAAGGMFFQLQSGGRSIDASSFQWGVGRVPGASTTASEADRESSLPTVSEIVITRTTDSSSPQIWQASTTNEHFNSVTIMMPNAAGVPTSYTLSDAVISKIAKNGGSPPTETLTLNFTEVKWDAPAGGAQTVTQPAGSPSSNPWAPH